MPDDANISEDRINECIASAKLWAKHLSTYSTQMKALADRYTIAATAISTITGLSVWGTIASTPKLWAQILVGMMAFAAAIVAMIPKVKGYSESATNVVPLITKYSNALGTLTDARAALLSDAPNAQIHAHAAIANFEAIKAEKDKAAFPTALKTRVDTERQQVIEAEQKATAEKAAARKAEIANAKAA